MNLKFQLPQGLMSKLHPRQGETGAGPDWDRELGRLAVADEQQHGDPALPDVRTLQARIAATIAQPQDLRPQRSASGSRYATTRFVRHGWGIIAATFVGFFGWAALYPLASAVVGQGVVAVESSRKQVQHLEGGIISELLVEEGETVDAGKVLARLDPTDARAGDALARRQWMSLQAKEMRLRAELSGAELLRPTLGSEWGPESAEIEAGERRQVEERRSVRDGEIDILKARMAQLESEIEGLEIQRQSALSQQEWLKKDLKRLRAGRADGVVTESEVSAVERAAAAMEGAIGQAVVAIAKARQSEVETQLQILQVEKAFTERASNELRTVETELAAARQRMTVAGDIYARTELRAPTAGMVQNIKFHTVGGVVRPGETIMEVVPVEDALVVDARIQPQDIDSVTTGATAEIRFPNFTGRDAPVIEGPVKFVSADLYFAGSERADPAYLARIEVKNAGLPAQMVASLKPGMPAEVIITGSRRTLLDYLLRPLSDSLHVSMREK